MLFVPESDKVAEKVAKVGIQLWVFADLSVAELLHSHPLISCQHRRGNRSRNTLTSSALCSRASDAVTCALALPSHFQGLRPVAEKDKERFLS